MSSLSTPVATTAITVLGAGSWGTALAILLAKNGQLVKLWGHDPQHIHTMRLEKANTRYLPDVLFPANLVLYEDIATALADSQDILLVVPSRAFVATLTQIKPYLRAETRLAWGTKGLTANGELLHNAAKQVLQHPHSLAVLSGPSFANEVAQGLPTAVTVAASDKVFAQALSTRLNSDCFRVYTSDDITGVEICGVVKNVLAIAAGLVDGLQLGANALSALITRGLVEMKRLANAVGGKPDTATGLAGVGDLVLSCTYNQSRNRRFGYAIASGKSVEHTLQQIGQAVEGYYNLKAVYHLAQQLKVAMPITEQVYSVIYQQKSPQAAIRALFSREPKGETD